LKTELEPQDIEAIANSIVEKLKPYIAGNSKQEDDVIFDVQGLAQYLRMKKQWVYERVHNNEIPYYKIGKYPRFKKSKIDQWLLKMEKGTAKKPISPVRRLLEEVV
jgi:excisionase family DNA binding protein